MLDGTRDLDILEIFDALSDLLNCFSDLGDFFSYDTTLTFRLFRPCIWISQYLVKLDDLASFRR
jgi:hypothetical protein